MLLLLHGVLAVVYGMGLAAAFMAAVVFCVMWEKDAEVLPTVQLPDDPGEVAEELVEENEKEWVG